MPQTPQTTPAVHDIPLPEEVVETGLPPSTPPRSRRILLAISVLVVLLLLALLPPYINVNHYQRRIVTSISSSLGRPVHLDSITLNLLPLPSFTLHNFVVDEDPEFGAEPIIRANSVTARLRASSLWRRRVEFATISFESPSVNLVHNPSGRWNLDSILLQASRVATVPTAQKHPGPAPRFPYIEATGARLNLKLGAEKTPYSLTDADFALWQGDPSQWRFRLKATPARTDSNVTDTGTLELEATLGRAAALSDVPLTLHTTWNSAPLGQTTRLLTGQDAGLRGDMALTADAVGTVGTSSLHTHLHLRDLRRDKFVPEHSLTVDLDCLSEARNQFHTFDQIRCEWPVAGTDHALVALIGSIPDLRTPRLLDLQFGTTRLPANTLIEWMGVASSRTPPGLTTAGYLNGTATINTTDATVPSWSAQAALGPLSLTSPSLGASPLSVGEMTLAASSPLASSDHHPKLPNAILLSPTTLDLGAKDPALLEGTVDASGYRFHLSGSVLRSRLLALAQTLPYLGESLGAAVPTSLPLTLSAIPGASQPTAQPSPIHVDLFAQRLWGGPQTWTSNAAATVASQAIRRHRGSRQGHHAR